MFDPLILPALDAARALNVSERKFHELRRTPGFPQAIALGPRCLRWKISDLQAWLDAQSTVQAQPEPERIRRARVARAGGAPR